MKNHGKTNENHAPIYNTRVYRIWNNMIQRCENKNNTHYSYYGERGIKVCEEWHNSKKFIEWALQNGYNDKLTIDRLDANGNYEPDNCRWATRKEQSQNIRSNRIITINGESHNVTAWSMISGINKNTLTKRLNNGWKYEDLLKPIDRRFLHAK